MSTNGNGKIDREQALREADRAIEGLEAEFRRLGAQLESYYAHREKAAAMLEQQKGVRRSTMSALEKSRYIEAHGKAAYDQLPWA